MAKKLGSGKCVHCFKDVEGRNSDHVFPASWYPDSTPPDLEKRQIPSCIPCNVRATKRVGEASRRCAAGIAIQKSAVPRCLD
jgi:hypothetical protein